MIIAIVDKFENSICAVWENVDCVLSDGTVFFTDTDETETIDMNFYNWKEKG